MEQGQIGEDSGVKPERGDPLRLYSRVGCKSLGCKFQSELNNHRPFIFVGNKTRLIDLLL